MLARLLHRWNRRRAAAQIRAACPDLAAAAEESDLITTYLDLATAALAKAEADYEAAPDELKGPCPQAPALLVAALPYFSDAPKASFVLLSMKQHQQINQLEAEKAWLTQQLALTTELTKLYEDREVIFQQVLDEAGIDAELVDRLAVSVNAKSIHLQNRAN